MRIPTVAAPFSIRSLTRAVLCWNFHTDSDGHGSEALVFARNELQCPVSVGGAFWAGPLSLQKPTLELTRNVQVACRAERPFWIVP